MGHDARRGLAGRRSPARSGGRPPRPRRRWARVAVLAALATAVLAASLLDREIGLGRWWRLAGDLERAEHRIEALRDELRGLEIERAELADDAFAIERAIREELDLALPGEIVVRTRPPAHALARVP